MKNKIFRKSILVLLVLTMLLPILSLFMLSVSADTVNNVYFQGYTLTFNENEYETYHEALDAQTNSEKLANGTFTNPVSTGAPQITVLIHGFAGTAAD